MQERFRTMLKSKIHRARVTDANVDYEGSLTVDSVLLKAADIYPGELVSVVDVTNAARLETYVIAGEPGSGVVCANGAAAHLIFKNDYVIIMSHTIVSEEKAKGFKAIHVYVDGNNKITRREVKIPGNYEKQNAYPVRKE